MTLQLINLGDSPDSNTGDSVYDAFIKVNDNLQEIYTFLGDGLKLSGGANINVGTMISNVVFNTGNLTTHDIWSYGNVRINYDIFANGYYYSNGVPVFGSTQFESNGIVAQSLILDGGNITYNNGSLLINGVPIGGVSNLSYDSGSGNLTLLSSNGSAYIVDIGVGRSETPTFNSLTVNNSANLNGGIYVNGNLVVDSNGNITSDLLLPNNGVITGTYGNASSVPVVTVDSKGLITSISTTAVAGVDNLIYDPISSNLTLSTSAGTEFTVRLASSSGLADEISRAEAAEANLQAQINALGNTDALMQTVEASLQSQITNLVNVDAITSTVESNLQSQITTLSTAIAADLASETSRATAAEVSIASTVNVETSRAQAAESSIAIDVTAEVSRALAAEATITSDLSNEVARATAAESSLAISISSITTDLASETSRATAAESSIAEALASEVTLLQSSLAAEAASRTAVDSSLQAQINALGNTEALMQTVESSLQSQITNLVNVDAITANIEANLQNQINNLSGLTNVTYDNVTGNLIISGSQRTFNVDLGIGSAENPTFNTVTTTANLNVGANTNVSGSIIPTAHEVYDLGSLDRAFRDLYLSGNSIYLSGTKLTSSAPGELSLTTNGQTTILNAAGNAGVITSNVSAQNFINNNSGNIVIDANGYVVDTSLHDTGVHAGLYGTHGQVPGLTIDTKGRVVNAAPIDIWGNATTLGNNTIGQLISNAAALSATTSITDGIAQLNAVLGKLVPPKPPAFPNNQNISVNGLTGYRMTNFTQTDNTASKGYSVAGGTLVNLVSRSKSYATTPVANVGPGDTGTVTAVLNGYDAGNVILTGSSNGTYGNLVIADNQDYHNVLSNVAAGFWHSFSASAAGVVNAGWNELYITDTAGSNTNTVHWYYDNSNPGAPTWSNTSIALTANVASYSSSIPHLTNASQFTISGNVNKLSGDMYPTSDTFITGAGAGALSVPTSITYTTAGITTPLERNLYVATGSAYISTTVTVASGFGAGTAGPSLTAQNSYAMGSHTFDPGVTILYKTGTTNQIEETSIPVNGAGSGSGNGVRIVNPGNSDTPIITANTVFDSQHTTLQSYDATVVAAVLTHDQTNYSVGYLPIGPDLSSGRDGAQYFTFKFTRIGVSKFDVKYSGNIAGLWVALPGSQIDSTSSLNGWLDMGVAYNGSGLPGTNNPGNGSNGCAIGGTVSLNTLVTNSSHTATFGTESSSNTATNEIFVRVKLINGQSVTSISIETATH
jgi:hypothetical protein